MNRKAEKTALPDEGRQIIRETVTYGLSTYLSQVVFLVRGIVIARFLDPSLYGIWSFLKVCFFFSAYTGLGTANAMSREVPYNRGRGEDQKDEGIVSTSLFMTLTVALLVALVALVWSFFELVGPYAWELRLSAAFFVTSAIHFYIPMKLNGEQKIMDLSRYMFAYTLFTSLFGLLLMFAYGLKGLVGGMLVASLSLHAAMVITGRLPYPLSFSAKIAGRLFITGFPIMVLSACVFMMHNMDKLIVFSMLGATNTGYYGLASFLSSLVYYIPSAISTVLFPRMMGDIGRVGIKMDENAYFFRPLLLLSGLMPVLLGVIFINIDLPVILLLPKYIPAVGVLRVQVAGLVFSTLWNIPANVAVAFDRQRTLMAVALGVLLLGGLFDVGAILLGYGIVGVAFGSALMFFVAAVAANVFAWFVLGKQMQGLPMFLFRLLAPFVYAGLCVWVAYRIPEANSIWMTNLLRTALYAGLVWPLVIYIDRKSNINQKIFGAFLKKRTA